MSATEPRAGVTINGGKAHVRQPGIRPKTRCGRPLRAPNQIVEVPDVDQLPREDRCAQCFPGSRA